MKRSPFIMVVDDDQEVLGLLRCIFELEGCDVAATADGRPALALLEECSPDLVILDIIMPELAALIEGGETWSVMVTERVGRHLTDRN